MPAIAAMKKMLAKLDLTSGPSLSASCDGQDSNQLHIPQPEWTRPSPTHSSFSIASTDSINSSRSSSSWRSRSSSFVTHIPAPPSHVPRVNINAACFDGGGVRGAATATVIKYVMQDLSKITGKKEHVHEHFDMLAGTSTGGLIAILLGRLGVPADVLVRLYSLLSKRLFSASFKLLRCIFRGSRYSGSQAEKEFGKIVSQFEASGRADAPLFDASEEAKCNVFVTSVNCADVTGEPVLLRSYEPEGNHRIVDAARATSAAPTFFPSVTLNTGEDVVDGGLGHNNPTILLIEEARKKYGEGAWFNLLLSIGTGLKGKVTLKKCSSIFSHLSLPDTLAGHITDSKSVDESVKALFEETDMGNYLRINIPGIGHFALDDYKSIPEIIRITEEHMKSPEGLEARRIVVECLLLATSERV